MKKKLTTVKFTASPEKAAMLDEAIERFRGQGGCLMPIMQEAQETFYSMFNLSPKGKYSISVCLGTACYVKGSQDVLDRLCSELGIGPGDCTEDGKFSIEACRCVGACGLAPVMMINDDVYGRLTPDMIPGILEKYKD